MQNAAHKGRSDFIEQTILLPRNLWTRVEDLCSSGDREPSELIAEALRMLMMGGGTPASVSGPMGGNRMSSLIGGRGAGAASLSDQRGSVTDVAPRLADVRGEKLGSVKLRNRLLEVMASVEAKDHFIERHAEKVASLARHTAEALGRPDDEVLAIETAALVHDIGKSRIPETVLGKKGRLDADEWALVKCYPVFSAEILEPFEKLQSVIELVRHHQERWDGSGYPDALAGDEIPFGAQVVGICDVYDVLTSERAYRPALTPDVARETIQGGAGRLWNPELVTVLLEKVLGT